MRITEGEQRDGERIPRIRHRAIERARPLLTLLEAIGTRVPTLGMHGESVGHYAAITAQDLGLPPARVEGLRLAGILHDVGKLLVPARILAKPGRLTRSEWAQVQGHPVIGYLLIAGAGLRDIAEWVLAHHERPDGRGYPFGLRSSEIPTEAAILAVTDAYHAMIAERPYQAPLTHAEARIELERCAGSQFEEPVVVAALRSIESDRRRTPTGIAV